MEKRIYIKDWLRLKPYIKQTKTDIYYLKICNEVKSISLAQVSRYVPYFWEDTSQRSAPAKSFLIFEKDLN